MNETLFWAGVSGTSHLEEDSGCTGGTWQQPGHPGGAAGRSGLRFSGQTDKQMPSSNIIMELHKAIRTTGQSGTQETEQLPSNDKFLTWLGRQINSWEASWTATP